MEYNSQAMPMIGQRLPRKIEARTSITGDFLRKHFGALEERLEVPSHNFCTWKVVRRSRATLAVAEGMDVTDIQEKVEWKTDAYNCYVAREEVDRLQAFGHRVDESSSSVEEESV